MARLNPQLRRDAFGKTINRDHSPLLVFGVPWLTIMLGSLTPLLPVYAPIPMVPPLAFLLLLGWRLLRPGMLPLWAGFPLGLFDDLYSGQPFGCAILLFSLTMIALELIEVRFPWRAFGQNWLLAAGFLVLYLLLTAMFAGTSLGYAAFGLLMPQMLISLALFPIIMHLVALLDRVRLLRLRRIG